MSLLTSRGAFLVLDGIDGCGKSTQAKRLCARLEAEHKPVRHVRDPGATGLGEALRSVLLERDIEIAPASETLLFAAARRALLDQLVAPALAAGTWVVCERFHASTFAYQSYAGSVDERALRDLLLGWAGAPQPDLVLILDLDAETARARRGKEQDRIEKKGLEFQRRVRAGYLRYANLEPRARVLDAQASAEEVERRVWAELCDGAA